jgi:hypothetical protein
MSLGYCSIQEAWGDPYFPSKKGEKKRRNKQPSVREPACHLYDMKNDKSMDDIFSMYDEFDKTNYSRNQTLLPLSDGPQTRNDPLYDANIQAGRDDYDVTQVEEFAGEEKALAPYVANGQMQTSLAAPSTSFGSETEFVNKKVQQQNHELTSRAMLFEFLSFVVAGLLLIFVLENVLTIGLHLRSPY